SGPPIVAARDDEIDLVVAAVGKRIGRAVLGLVERAAVGLPRDALNVAVPERPDRRPGRRIVGRDRPILVQAQDLSGEAARVLPVGAVLGVTRRDVELSVGTELQAAAVMVVVAGYPVDDHGLFGADSVLVTHADDLVARRAARCRVAVVEVDEGV